MTSAGRKDMVRNCQSPPKGVVGGQGPGRPMAPELSRLNCTCCGNPGHDAGACLTDVNKVCGYCARKGHLARGTAARTTVNTALNLKIEQPLEVVCMYMGALQTPGLGRLPIVNWRVALGVMDGRLSYLWTAGPQSPWCTKECCGGTGGIEAPGRPCWV